MDLISFTIFAHVKRLLYNVELSTLVNICIRYTNRAALLRIQCVCVEQLRFPRLLVGFQSEELLP